MASRSRVRRVREVNSHHGQAVQLSACVFWNHGGDWRRPDAHVRMGRPVQAPRAAPQEE